MGFLDGQGSFRQISRKAVELEDNLSGQSCGGRDCLQFLFKTFSSIYHRLRDIRVCV